MLEQLDIVGGDEALEEKYRSRIRMVERMPDALAAAMANQVFIATFSTKEEMDAFLYDATICG